MFDAFVNVTRENVGILKAFNSSPPGQDGRHFAEYIFICIFVNEKLCVLSKMSLKFVSKSPMDIYPALV